jgi:FkbM family methyltransferase
MTDNISSMPVRSGLRRARRIAAECGLAKSRTDGPASFVRCATDVLLYRGLRYWDLPGRDRERGIQFKNGAGIRYRLNRGDIQTIREVWLQECYRPPVDVPADLVVDLGANIGLTSLWYAKRYGAKRVLCVEPVPENARLARLNLIANGVEGEVLEAAVGPENGLVHLDESGDFNLGRVADHGRPVPAMSIEAILGHLPADRRIDLLKVDIEGAEEALIQGDLDWLDRVGAVIAELHPALGVDCSTFIARLESHGFRYVPARSVRWNSMDFWFRPQLA